MSYVAGASSSLKRTQKRVRLRLVLGRWPRTRQGVGPLRAEVEEIIERLLVAERRQSRADLAREARRTAAYRSLAHRAIRKRAAS